MARPIWRNYLTLAVTAFGVWSAALIHRILVVRMAGNGTLGLYQMIFPAYRLLATVVTVGLPIVLTTTTADLAARGDLGQARQSRNGAARVILMLSLTVSVILWISRSWLASRAFPDPRVAGSLLFLPFALVFSCESAVWQAYYQGLNNMRPYAVSQAVEQVTRLGMTWVLLGRGGEPAHQAAAAMAASAAAEVAGFLALYFYPRPQRESDDPAPHEGLAPVLRGMLVLAIPLMLSGFVSSALQMVNVMVVPRRLVQCGMSVERATEALGTLFGMVLPMIFFPMVLVFPMAGALLPVISASAAQTNKNRRTSLLSQLKKAYAGAIILGAFTCILLALFGDRLALLIYGTAVDRRLILTLAPVAPFAYTGVISITILNGLKKNYTVLGLSFADALMETFLLYALTRPQFGGLSGTAVAVSAGSLFYAALAGSTAWCVMTRIPSYQPFSSRATKKERDKPNIRCVSSHMRDVVESVAVKR